MKIYSVVIKPEEDCDFLNECKIKHAVIPKGDFGYWYDAPTNAIILGPGDIVDFMVEESEDELLLRLKFGDRISEDK